MKTKDHPEQGFNAALGVIRLADRFTAERLEAACARAIEIASPHYKTIQTMLKNRMESAERPVTTTTRSAAVSPDQLSFDLGQNVRGKGYYH